MEPRIFSPTSPDSSLLEGPYSRSISLSLSEDSFRPLLATHDLSEEPLFDPYTPDKMNTQDTHYPYVSSSPMTSSPATSERSSLDDSPPLANSPSQATITQAALRAEGKLKLKKKRSLGQALKSFRSSSRDLTESLRGIKRVPSALQLGDSSILTIGSENLPGSVGMRYPEEDEVFEDRNKTIRRRNMPHHPFRSEDVPYMQAYNQILLENDYQTHQLLCRLAPADSPTFHRFGKKPPADVLDLGCGEGFWVLHAAKHWKSTNTKVTGLDLIDVHNNEVGEVHPLREPAHIPKNVTWTRANFVKHALPFPDNSFDFVRMANLTLCIPITRWKFVLTQVRRVLRPGGRLELIDDELFFPSVLPRPARHIPLSPSMRQWPLTPTPSNDASGHGFNTLTVPPPSPRPLPQIPSLHGLAERSHKGHARTRSDVEFSTNAAIAANVETIFTNMLDSKYGITPRPHVFLLELLRETFGSDCARETQKLELTVPSRELSESSECIGLGITASPGTPTFVLGHAKRPSEDEKHKSGWLSDKMEKRSWSRAASPTPGGIRVGSRERRNDDGGREPKMDAQLAGALTPKARQLLFGDIELPTAHASANGCRTPSWRANAPYQPPGLVLLQPSTLIPFTPGEVEMHACKHMNTLLGCKYALGKYVAGQRGADGLPLLSDREMDDYLWDYECFRRKRFNWPQEVPGLQFDDEPEEPLSPPLTARPLNIFNKIAGSGSAAGTPPARELKRSLSTECLSAAGSPLPVYGGVEVGRQQSTHVRTIRVWEAVKAPHCVGCNHNGAC